MRKRSGSMTGSSGMSVLGSVARPGLTGAVTGQPKPRHHRDSFMGNSRAHCNKIHNGPDTLKYQTRAEGTIQGNSAKIKPRVSKRKRFWVPQPIAMPGITGTRVPGL